MASENKARGCVSMPCDGPPNAQDGDGRFVKTFTVDYYDLCGSKALADTIYLQAAMKLGPGPYETVFDPDTHSYRIRVAR